LETAKKSGKKELMKAALSILPLNLFQPNDARQLSDLYTVVKNQPEAIHYYLRQHVFPVCMNFQKSKISACGHELGSDILFGRRIGFSGKLCETSL
jgi:hypothetical protein